MLAIAFALVMALPVAATASPFVNEWGILGPSADPPARLWPAISDDNIIYGQENTETVVGRFNLVSGTSSIFRDEVTASIDVWDVSGDWVMWSWMGDTLLAKNIKTGVTRDIVHVGFEELGQTAISAVDGAYVLWCQEMAVGTEIRAKNIGINGSAFTVAGGSSGKAWVRIYGKRVVYVDYASGRSNILVKTIGSSAPPLKITDNALDQSNPDIGSHLVAWTVDNASGHSMIRYYDFDTGLTYDGPTSPSYEMYLPRVSGDRILYSVDFLDNSDRDIRVWDTRVAIGAPSMAAFDVAATAADETNGDIDGDQMTYVRDHAIVYARLVVPHISLDSVPARIAKGGHIHLTGSISDRGHRIGGALIGIEKYSSGKWTRIKTLVASASGAFSYKTPKTYSKTKYRVVYNGRVTLFAAPVTEHLSTVSAVKTAWPR